MKKPIRKSCLFDVVIPTFNNVLELKLCLRALERQSLRSFRVLVCVDGSTDGTNRFLLNTCFPYPLKVLFHPDGRRRGPAATRNLGLKCLDSPFLCMIDSDVIPDEKLLEAHLDLIGKRDVLSMGKIILANSGSNRVAGYLRKRGTGKFTHGKEVPGFYLNTQNVAMRSSHFIALGGFDENFSLSYGGDDTDLGYRLAKTRRLAAVFNGSAFVSVCENKTVSFFLSQMRVFGASSLHLIRKKHPEFSQLFGVKWYETQSVRGRLARFLIRGSLAEKLERLAPVIPIATSHRLIHALVFLNMGKGYLSSEMNGKKENLAPTRGDEIQVR